MAMVELLVSDVKFYTISHIYDETCYLNDEFLIGIITNTNIIKVLKILHGEKQFEYVIDIYTILPRKLKDNFQYINIDKLDLIYLQSLTTYYTLFLKISLFNKQYVYQINVHKDKIINFEPILKLYETTKLYIGYSDTKRITYTDKGEVEIPIRGILYIDTDNPTDISNKYIRQIKVYTTNEEKQQLVQEGKIQNYDIFPIVDKWSKQDAVVMHLPNNISSHQFDFSVGLGLISFKE